MWHHNGTEWRVLLPLWKEEEDAICATESIARMPLKELFRNGRKTREKLPLWGGGRETERKHKKGNSTDNWKENRSVLNSITPWRRWLPKREGTHEVGRISKG